MRDLTLEEEHATVQLIWLIGGFVLHFLGFLAGTSLVPLYFVILSVVNVLSYRHSRGAEET